MPNSRSLWANRSARCRSWINCKRHSPYGMNRHSEALVEVALLQHLLFWVDDLWLGCHWYPHGLSPLLVVGALLGLGGLLLRSAGSPQGTKDVANAQGLNDFFVASDVGSG